MLGLFHARAGRIGGMSEERKKKSGAVGATIAVLVILFTLPVLCVLSTGPATWLCERGYVSKEAAGDFYTPLRWVTYRCKPLEDFVYWYDKLFVPAPHP